MNDMWEQLAQTPVPPPPEKFDRAVHERINRSLVIGHLADFVLRCLPYALWHFGKGLLGAVWFSLTGRFPVENRDSRKNSPPDVT